MANESRGHLTVRFKHVVTKDGHAVITGRDVPMFQYCEDEPIRMPGAIQSFGVMIALRECSNRLMVRVVSENSREIIGYTPEQLFGLENFCDILMDDQATSFLDHVQFVCDGAYDPGLDGPEVFSLSVAAANGGACHFWCATHFNQAQNLVICEFEPQDDKTNPLNVSGTETLLDPTSTLGIVPTAEQLAASNINISQPIRVFHNSRRKKGEAASMDVLNILPQVQKQLGTTSSLEALLNTTTGLVKELTGFHKVLIYQFDKSWNGQVVSELVDPKATIDLYKGLRFPACDIPPQARDLYKINKVRLIYDRDQVTSRLVCRELVDLETPVDMTHAYLRAISPIHLKYLAHMEIRASMSISITVSDNLWGLISCHSYGIKGMRVSFAIRKICRLLGDAVSQNVERLSNASRLQVSKLIKAIPFRAKVNPSAYIIASSDELLRLFNADYVAISLHGQIKILGDDSASQEILALLWFLRVRQDKNVLASYNIVEDFPGLYYPPGIKAVSGLLYMPLSTGCKDLIVFFRKGQLTEIHWGGNPYDIEKRKETVGYLEPRSSFAAWRETVRTKSREWSKADVESAAVLCHVYKEFINARRHEESGIQNTQLSGSALSSSADDLRSPLNAIIHYLDLALDGTLDEETRGNLTESQSASKSLLYVINDLLDQKDDHARDHSSSDTSVPHAVFNSGIHVWCISVIHEPYHQLKFDPRGFFFIEWQSFTLGGQPTYVFIGEI
jgi:light-regulated signal transduction histidine kinase (bacteriophytochrome)